MKKSNIESLIIEYIENKVTEDIKSDFINSVIHFIINEDICSNYDIMRIKYRFKKIQSKEVINYIKLCSVYGYIIYRSLLLNLVKEEEKSICCEAVLSISNEITRYVTMEDDENELYSKMKKAINNLDISTRCEELVINKFEGIPVLI